VDVKLGRIRHSEEMGSVQAAQKGRLPFRFEPA
jgi:hypothetical protein